MLRELSRPRYIAKLSQVNVYVEKSRGEVGGGVVVQLKNLDMRNS